MKRTLTVLISILVGIFIILSLLGDKDYPAEKALYAINKKYSLIKQDTLATPEGRFKEVIADYMKFIKKYPSSQLTPVAHLLIGRTHLLNKDYEMARSTFERVIQQYDKERPAIAAQAIVEIAGCYLQEKNYGAVIKAYDRLIRDYPLTKQGMEAPLQQARVMTETNQPLASEAYNNAVKYYRQLILKNGKSSVSFTALNYIAGAQMMQKHWQQVIDAYTEILMGYSEPKYLDNKSMVFLLQAINSISLAQLNNVDLPVNIYKRFMDTNPNHRLNPLLMQMIKGLADVKFKMQEQQAKQQAGQQATAPAAK